MTTSQCNFTAAGAQNVGLQYSNGGTQEGAIVIFTGFLNAEVI